MKSVLAAWTRIIERQASLNRYLVLGDEAMGDPDVLGEIVAPSLEAARQAAYSLYGTREVEQSYRASSDHMWGID